jgi:hypothetical protein
MLLAEQLAPAAGSTNRKRFQNTANRETSVTGRPLDKQNYQRESIPSLPRNPNLSVLYRNKPALLRKDRNLSCPCQHSRN